MALTKSFRETVVHRVQNDPEFRTAMMERAAECLLNGEQADAVQHIRDLVNASMGFDALATDTGIGKTSLMRMLAQDGNPRLENLSAILRALEKRLGIVRLSVRAELESA